MIQSKAFYVAAAPVLLLLLIGAGPRIVTPPGDDTAAAQDDARIDGSEHVAIPKPVDAQTQRALEKTVAGQLSSFQKGDYKQALTYSAASFRRTFSPDDFRQMVLSRFSPLASATKHTFKPAQGSDLTAMMAVTIADKAGNSSNYLYMFEKENGMWYITGCADNPTTSPPKLPDSGARVMDVREI